jgi:hypothetical protein
MKGPGRKRKSSHVKRIVEIEGFIESTLEEVEEVVVMLDLPS